MKRTMIYTATIVAAAGFFAFGANAQQQGAQAQQRMSVAQVAGMLEEQGYTVLEVELERGRYDVEMIDSRGMRVEAYLDPVTGATLPYHDDDDDYRRGWDDDRGERDDD